MTMQFGRLECIRCSMSGHLSYQCKAPIMPAEAKPEPIKAAEPELPEHVDGDIYDAWLC